MLVMCVTKSASVTVYNTTTSASVTVYNTIQQFIIYLFRVKNNILSLYGNNVLLSLQVIFHYATSSEVLLFIT